MFHSPFDQPEYKPKKKAKKKAKKVAKKKKKKADVVKCGHSACASNYINTGKKSCLKRQGKDLSPGVRRKAKKKVAKKKKKKAKKKVAKKRVAKKAPARKKAPAKKAKKTRSKVPNPFNMLKPTAAKNKKVNAAIDRAIGYVAWSEVRGSAPNMEFVQSLFYSHVQPTLYEISETDTETNDAVFTELAARAVKAIAKAKKKTKKKKAPTRSRPPSSSLGGVRVHCVREGGKIRVRPVPGQGYPSTKNIQFPRDKRHEGCQYIVDALDDKGTHFRAVGEIRPF